MHLVWLKLVNEAWFGLPICSHQGGWLNLMMTVGHGHLLFAAASKLNKYHSNTTFRAKWRWRSRYIWKKNEKLKLPNMLKSPKSNRVTVLCFKKKKMHKWSNYYLYMYKALGKMEMVRSKTSKVYCVSLPSPWFHFLSFLSIRLPCAQFITTWQTDVSTDGNCSDPSCYIQMCWQRGLF